MLMWVFRPPISSYFFIERTTKTKDLCASRISLGACCLTILILLICFNMFKGAMRPRYTYIPRLKGVGLYP